MRRKMGSNLVPNFCMGEEEGKGGDAGRFSLILCRIFFDFVQNFLWFSAEFSLLFSRISQILVRIYSLLHCSTPKLFRKSFFGFPKSYFTTFNHFHAAICFIPCQTTSPFIRLSPQPQSEHIIFYRSISFDIPPIPSCLSPLPSRGLSGSQAAHGAGQQESSAISPKLKARLCLPTGRARWDRLLLILP